MPAEASLQSFMRRIRRRLRGWRALEGAISGGAAALAVASLWIGAAHLRGSPVAMAGPLLLAAAGAALGAAIRAVGRIPLDRCARIADRALDGQDRVLSALWLAGHDGPFARALVADAVARLATLAPEVAFPVRRPRALPLAAVSALALVVAAVSPVRSRAARPVAPPAVAVTTPRAVPIAAELDAEQTAARDAAEAARRLDDARLAGMARDLERLIEGLRSGTLDAGEALDRMKALEATAGQEARAAAADERARDAALEALAKQAATRAAAQALRASGEGAPEGAQAALGSAAEAHPAETGRALSAAARGVGAATGASGDEKSSAPGQRRLSREGNNAGPSGASGAGAEEERRLERLRRDLDDAGASCRAGDAECRRNAEARAQDLSRLARRAAAAEALRQVERAARQLRSRMGRGDLAEGDDAAARRFQRAAKGGGDQNGEAESAGADSAGASSGATGMMEGGNGQPGGERGNKTGQPGAEGQPGEGESGLDIAAQQAGGAGQAEGAGSGEGVGRQPGGEPLGQASDTGSRGHAAEARVADGAGPNRAQVIGSAGGRGFASEGYARVFSDYSGAVEDALGATAVPEGKRFLVRRYFDLIRPRPATRGGRR